MTLIFCKGVDKVVVTLAHNGHDSAVEASSTQSDISEEVEAPSTAALAKNLQGKISTNRWISQWRTYSENRSLTWQESSGENPLLKPAQSHQ